MDDQNQINQPIVPDTTPPVVPSVPEDITPVETPTATTTTTTTTESVTPIETPITPPVVTAPISPWPVPEPMNVPTPTPETTTTTTTVTSPTPIEPISTPVEPTIPEKPKSKVLPILGVVAALLLVVGVAGAAYYVSNQLSTRQAVAPTAPESKPLAAVDCGALYEATCKIAQSCVWNSATKTCSTIKDNCGSGFTCKSLSSGACQQADGDQGSCVKAGGASGTCCVPKTTPTPPPATDNSTGGGDNDDNETTTTSGESSSSLYVSKPTDGCGSTDYHRYDCGTQCCRTTSGGAKDANCCTSGCKEPDSSGILNGAEEKQWCESDTIDQFQEANQITFKRTGTAAIYLSGTFHYKVTLTKKSGDGAASFSIPSSGDYVTGGTSYTIGTVSAGSVYTMSVTLKEDVDVSRGASLGWRKPKSVQTAHPSCDASGTVTKASALFDINTETTDVDYPVMCWADSIITGGPDQSMAEKYDFDDFTVAVGYSSATITDVGVCSLISIYKKVNGSYSSTPLTASELQNLKVGDILKFVATGSVSQQQGKFRVTINGVAGDWMWTNVVWSDVEKKLLTYTEYKVATVGTYKFEAQVTTTP